MHSSSAQVARRNLGSTRTVLGSLGEESQAANILNSVDVKALKTYQQLVIYFIPIISNMGFINIIVVIVRLHWFEKRFKHLGKHYYNINISHFNCQQIPEYSGQGCFVVR